MTEKQIFDYLKANGMTDAGAAGMLGNIHAESGMSSINLENSKEVYFNDITYTNAVDTGMYTRAQFCNDRSGYGLCQWTSAGRKAALYDLAKRRGASISDASVQCEHLMNELKTSYVSVLKVLKTTNSIHEASDAVLLKFEIPYDRGEHVKQYRASLGQGVYDRCAGVKTMANTFQFQNPIKTNLAFAETAVQIAKHYKTYYVNGCFGAPMNASNKKRYTQNTQYNRNHAAQIMALPPDTYGFDCVCLLKGILWGWCGNLKDVYGGAKYGSNGVGDIGENTMIAKCIGVSTDFKNVQIGEMLWMDGHAGIYIGDGLAVECTPSWKNGVQITAVLNIGKKEGYNGRKWTKHGMLPYFAYVGGNVTQKPEKPSDDLSQYTDEQLADMVMEGVFGSNPKRRQMLGDRYRAVQDIIEERYKKKPNAPEGIVYTVSAGDTLTSIAKKYKTTVEKIMQTNPQIKDKNKIYVGQKIGIKV